MDVSALVLTFARDRAPDGLLARLADDDRVTLGEIVEHDGARRLPFTFEGSSRREHFAFFDSVQQHPAAALLTLVFHHYDHDTPS